MLKLIPVAGAWGLFADCEGVAARGLQPAFFIPVGFLHALIGTATKIVGRQDGAVILSGGQNFLPARRKFRLNR